MIHIICLDYKVHIINSKELEYHKIYISYLGFLIGVSRSLSEYSDLIG